MVAANQREHGYHSLQVDAEIMMKEGMHARHLKGEHFSSEQHPSGSEFNRHLPAWWFTLLENKP